ncbi:MAG: ASKHA domain-containing protein [bacterium]
MPEGSSLLSLLQKRGIFIDASCGGRGRCGRCRVLIKENPRPPNKVEKILIPDRLLKKGYRLACLYMVRKIPKIHIPEYYKESQKVNIKNTGLAIDIGTTVIKGALVDLSQGEILKTAKIYNPQQSYGGDLITRLDMAVNRHKYRVLRNLLIKGIETLKKKLNAKDLGFTTIVGNTVMLSFYLGKSVKGLSCHPFQGEITEGVFLKNPSRYIFGCIGGFIGGDTISGIIASKILSNNFPSLYIDLGTNGEIALVFDKKIYAVSTAAGPAFEGAGLSCGSLAQAGAIETVAYNKRFKIYTIDNKPPIGFCASGLIDLLAVILKLDWLDEYGRLKHKLKVAGFDITQKDIRTLQLAIGAIHTGVKFLIDNAGIKSKDIGEAVITGEFGSHLNSKSLSRVGILPLTIKNIRMENDLPLRGAISLLLNQVNTEDVEKVRKCSTHFDLALQTDFQKRFVEGLFLKPWN